MKNLAFLIWTGETFGGGERRYIRLAQNIHASGCANVKIFCHIRTLAALQRQEIEVDPKIFRTFGKEDSNESRFLKFVLMMRIIWSIRKDRMDFTHICNNPGLISFLYAAMFLLLPSFSVSMNAGHFNFNAGFLQKRVFAPVTAIVCTKIDCLTELTKTNLEKFIPRYTYQKLVVAPCSFTDYSQVKQSDHRHIDVLFISRFVPGKGLDLLAEASKELEGVNLHVCGSGPYLPNIPYGKIYHTNDPFGIMSRTKIVLSLQEVCNYPSQVVLEAMASGCAIIATDVGETHKFLNEDCSILIPPSPERLRWAIRHLLNSNDIRSQLASAAKSRAFSSYTVDRYRDHFISEIVT